MSIAPIRPSEALYIKLGRGGAWERECLEVKQILRVGYREIPDKLCRQGKWDEVKEKFKHIREDEGTATHDTNQLRYFYEADETVLWTTFFGDRLYWCFSKHEVTLLEDGAKIRPAIGQWRSTDIKGNPLQKTQLSGPLLSMQGFRGTICHVKEFKYLVQKINCIVQPEIEETLNAKALLENRVSNLIRKLNWKDFELLIDLIFRQAGWQRVGVLGKTEKTIDLDLLYPMTEERCLVQVKSAATLKKFQSFQDKLSDYQDYDRVYFIVHSPSTDLTQANTDEIKIWLPQDIARRAITYGLADWIIAKTS